MNNFSTLALKMVLALLLCGHFGLIAQTENQILDDQIYTVQLARAGAPLSFPVVDLQAGNNVLVLQFDHLGDELKDYKYTIEHCNIDWRPSDLNASEIGRAHV